MIRDYFYLAIGNLKHRGIRSWLTMLGIVIGIVAVVSLIMLGSGLKMTINSQFGIGSTEVITVQAGGLNSYGPPGSGVVNPLTIKDLEEIKKIRGVKNVLGSNIETRAVEFNKIQIFGYLGSSPIEKKELEFFYENIDAKVIEGKLLNENDRGKVLVGYNFYVDKMGFGKRVYSKDTILIEGEKFEVVGILEKKGSFIFDNVIYMNNEDLKNIAKYGDELDFIDVQVDDKDLINKVKEDIEKVLRKSRNVKIGEEDFEVSTPEAALATVNQILLGVQIFIFLIAFISIIVGSIGIVNTMTTAVMERRKEIGVMKATGAKNSQIFSLFFIESGLMGLVGGIIGVIIGVTIGYLGTLGLNNFVGASTRPQVDLLLISLTLIGSFLIGAVSGIVPALQAAKQNPVEALRS
jgi:putative ABC transport system permease protein